MRKMEVILDGQAYIVELDSGPSCRSTLRVKVNGASVEVLIPNLEGQIEELHWFAIDGCPYELDFDPDLHWVRDVHDIHDIQIKELGTRVSELNSKGGPVKAPIPGQVTQLLTSPGEMVKAGQPLLLLEAMKMQNEIRSQTSGIVQSIRVTAGENVKRGDILVEILPPSK